jgi:formylglycine-generating enzyme required for sulfatase activity
MNKQLTSLIAAGLGVAVGSLFFSVLSALPAQTTEPGKKPFTNSLGMKLVYVSPGKFTMGSPVGEKGRVDNEQEHDVEITRGFFVGAYEVTQEEYQKVMGKNPSWFSAEGGAKSAVVGINTRRFPVENVAWADAVAFCKELSKKESKTYDLPTEAEWEYACRAEKNTPFHFGKALNGRQANCNGNYPYGTDAKGVFLQRPCQVGTYASNKLGLYDMHGNVLEWCKDWYGSDYYANSPAKDPQGPESGTHRILRGGSWLNLSRDCRSAYRGHDTPDSRGFIYGFRVVLRVD